MEQPWKNQQREGGRGYHAMGESSCHAAGLDQAMTTTDPCEVIDGALLMMELMDQDLPSSDLLLDGDVDHRQLSHVIRSLEAEIGGDQQAAAVMPDEGGESLERIEDVLSDDMDGYGYEEGASSSFGYWPQVVSSSLLAGGHDEAEGWCVYTNTSSGYEGGGVLGYDTTTVDHQYYYCCAEGPADHMYLPLWE